MFLLMKSNNEIRSRFGAERRLKLPCMVSCAIKRKKQAGELNERYFNFLGNQASHYKKPQR